MSEHGTSINLKELSYLTGFSISTVSKALNDKFDISVKTKKIITNTAKEHNYVPNKFAAGLRNKKSFTVAVIIPQINVTFYSDLLFYFQKIAELQGYRIVVFQSFEEEKKEIDYLKRICDGSVDGAIVLTSTKNNSYNKEYTIPVISLFISEALCQDKLKEYCFQIFNDLLVKID